MRFRIEFSAASARDFELVFDHLVNSYRGFGERREDAMDHAMRRVLAIRRPADRLGTAPTRGTARDDILPGLRHLSLDRATYWFEANEPARRVAVLAVFFGGQDHVWRMLVRLLGGSGRP